MSFKHGGNYGYVKIYHRICHEEGVKEEDKDVYLTPIFIPRLFFFLFFSLCTFFAFSIVEIHSWKVEEGEDQAKGEGSVSMEQGGNGEEEGAEKK